VATAGATPGGEATSGGNEVLDFDFSRSKNCFFIVMCCCETVASNAAKETARKYVNGGERNSSK
jgi:hypothetical protein